MNNFIPLSVPLIQGNEWSYVKECLDTGWVSSVGQFVERFERGIAEYTGAAAAIACVNGTAALHIALILANVGPEDEVLVPTLTFIATVNAVRYTGATPVFMDCDSHFNIDAEKTLEFLKKECILKSDGVFNRASGRRVKAIVPVHIMGNAAPLEPLLEFCRSHGLALIEDAAESLGTRYTEGPLAPRHTGTIGEIGILSFNGNKILTTGGGGMLLTNDVNIAKRAKHLTTQAKSDELYYVHDEVGYNYRMSNVTAAIGLAQLEQLPTFIASKRSNFELYQKLIEPIDGLTLIKPPSYCTSNYWMYPLAIDRHLYKHSRDEVMQRLTENKIQARPLWLPNHLQEPYKNCLAYKIEKAPELYESTLNIPCSSNLTTADVERIAGVLRWK